MWCNYALYEFGRVTVRGGCNTVYVVLSAVILLPCPVLLGVVSPDPFVYVLVRVLLPYLAMMELISPCSEQCEEAIVLMRSSVASAVSLRSTWKHLRNGALDDTRTAGNCTSCASRRRQKCATPNNKAILDQRKSCLRCDQTSSVVNWHSCSENSDWLKTRQEQGALRHR